MISKLLSYVRVSDRRGAKVSDVKHDPGAGAIETGEHFQPANTDSVPLPGDYLVTSSVRRTGGEVIVGFIDPGQEQKAGPGEHRTYARGEGGSQVAELHLHADGSVTLTTQHGTNTFGVDGSVVFSNGAQITAAGDFVTAAGISLDQHVHVGNLGANTSVPVP